jgi:hypothetical protein
MIQHALLHNPGGRIRTNVAVVRFPTHLVRISNQNLAARNSYLKKFRQGEMGIESIELSHRLL